MARYFILERPSYIAAQLLAEGSRITDADLQGAEPGSALIETDERGVPLNPADTLRLVNLGVSLVPPQIAPVAPHAPNPTQPQAFPASGSMAAIVGNAISAEPAEGVESREAAKARRDHLQAQLAAAQEALDAIPAEADATLTPEAPKRRGEQEEPGPLDQSIGDLTAHLETVNDAETLAALRRAEVAGKSRSGALAAIDARNEALKPTA